MPNWSNLPSLPALRAFEAAARTGGFSAAARELNVTHAAIAQHVRSVEAHFGRAMMRRTSTGMAPLDDALPLVRALTEGFDGIAAEAARLTARDEAAPIRLALTPSFAGTWLMPRIGSFWAQHPDIKLEIVPAEELVDLHRGGFDLAIRYGRGKWPGVTATMLASAGHTLVAAPSRAPEGGIGDLSDLAGAHLILERGRGEERLWAAENGLNEDAVRLTELDSNLLVIEAVRAGHGLGILPAAIVSREVADGSLVALCRDFDSPLAYYILTTDDRKRPALVALIRWLKKQI